MKFCPKCGKRLRLLTGRARGQAICPNCGNRVADVGEAEAPVEPVKTALAQSFPYGTMRPYQKDVLDQIESALGSGKKFIILEAPVGFGKSAVAAALCRHLRSAYVLTSTKQLQEQYSADFGFTTVMGKSNFTCLVPTSSGRLVACSKGRCEADWSLSDCPHYLSFDQYEAHLKGLCDKRESKCEKVLRTAGEGKLCTYYKQKWDSFRQRVTVGNYAFFFSELRFTEDVRKRKLLVCDEAHDLERQLVGSASFMLKASTIRQYPSGAEKEFAIPYEEGMESHAEDWLKSLGTAKESLQGFFDAHDGDLNMQDRLISCRGMLESLEGFIDALKASPENWIVSDVRKSTIVDAYGGGSTLVDEVVFQPLDVAAYTSQLFSTAETVLLMSATVFSEELMCRTLGIPEEKASFIRVAESSFPVENRRIHAMDVAPLSWATMNSSMEGIAKAVDAVMTRHADERGIVHTTSYQQANYIIEHVSERNRARLATTEGSGARSNLLHAHGTTEASVLISPSLYQGVDLKDDLARFQVIVKVPFSDLSDRRTQIKMRRDRGWYDLQTALRLVQTYGRSVRSETDHAVTYILDSNFPSFVNSHRDLFPKYFLEALSDPGM
jgi:ATP-dependent DNA helicase DinG